MTTHSEFHPIQDFKNLIRNLDEQIEAQVQKTIDEVEKEYEVEAGKEEPAEGNSKFKIQNYPTQNYTTP